MDHLVNNAGINSICNFEDAGDITNFRVVKVIHPPTLSEIRIYGASACLIRYKRENGSEWVVAHEERTMDGIQGLLSIERGRFHFPGWKGTDGLRIRNLIW